MVTALLVAGSWSGNPQGREHVAVRSTTPGARLAAPTLIEGTVTPGASGQGNARSLTLQRAADIYVYVEKQIPTGSTSSLIAEGHTTPAGKFVIPGNLRDKDARDALEAATRNPDGSVFLEIVVDDGVQERHFNLDAIPPAAGRSHWTWGEVADPSLLAAAPGDPVNELARKPLTGLELTLDSSHRSVGTMRVENTGEGRAEDEIMLQDHKGGCRSGSWLWMTGTAVKRWLPMAMALQHNRTKQTVTWNTTRRTKFQIVYGLEGEFKSTAVKGGLSYSTTNISGAGVEHNYGDVDATKYSTSQARWKVQKQKKVCAVGWVDSYGVFHQTGTTDSGHRRFRARKWLGDTRRNNNGDQWFCNYNYRARTPGPIWVENGRTTVFGQYVGIAGLQVDTSQGNTSSTKVRLDTTQSFRRMAVCGYKTSWPYASAIREVSWY